jgi:P-type E1-E2 ATPase
LVTDDTAEPAARVGRSLQLGEVHPEFSPEDKLQEIQRLQQRNKKVAMVGDGINDAPALVQADVGIAMGSGTDVAQESADVVLIGNYLSKLSYALLISRKCRQIIMQNFYGTLLVDGVGIILAASGFLTLLTAAMVHVTSELAFILNSARLLPYGDQRRGG